MTETPDDLAAFVRLDALQAGVKEIGARIGLSSSVEVVRAALALLDAASAAKAAGGAQLVLRYPDGREAEMHYWKKRTLRLAAKDGRSC